MLKIFTFIGVFLRLCVMPWPGSRLPATLPVLFFKFVVFNAPLAPERERTLEENVGLIRHSFSDFAAAELANMIYLSVALSHIEMESALRWLRPPPIRAVSADPLSADRTSCSSPAAPNREPSTGAQLYRPVVRV